ncbi:ricin B lectin:Parallel beta-helix repeat [Streptomyces griseoflavus Tu4000]|uniref:Ricin B lectin:Parallel beta-helix repeat n=2 Tax=Streptomyces griseoflavus TaxID=35619 RepID=D9XVD5_9ACTN|nr:ricin B lectin:Parallel beta-helix repeat [Streptomyces griseoflavus Tu4000]
MRPSLPEAARPLPQPASRFTLTHCHALAKLCAPHRMNRFSRTGSTRPDDRDRGPMRRRAALLAAAATALLTAAGTLTTPATAATPATHAPTTTTPAPAPARAAACGDGSYQAEAVLNGSTWTARRGSSTVYTGTDMRAAVQAAISSLSAGRTSKERVVVRGSGSVSAGSRISLPSYTALDVCGTINVTGSGSGDQAPVYSRGTRDIEVQHLNVTGAPLYGIFLRNVQNVVLGQIDMRLSAGLGVRIDNRGDTSQWTRNVRIDDVYVSGASSHAVETYGVDGLTVGTVTARNVGESGLLLNQTINATVAKVDAENAGTGTGYAAFRMANRNGRIGSSYSTNIRVGEVVARGGGRGVFCVSESGGATIDRITLSNTGNNAILIENCYNVNLAAQSGTVTGGGEIRLAARTEFANNRDITVQNLTVTNSSIRESPCGENTTFRNNRLVNSSQSIC